MVFTSRTYLPPVDEEEQIEWQPEFDLLHLIGQRFSATVPLIAQTAMQKVLQKTEQCYTVPGSLKLNRDKHSLTVPTKFCEKCKCVQVLGQNATFVCGEYDRKVLKDLKQKKLENTLSSSGKKKLVKIMKRKKQIFIKCQLCQFNQLQNALLLKRNLYRKINVKSKPKWNEAKITWLEKHQELPQMVLKKSTKNILEFVDRRPQNSFFHGQKQPHTKTLKRPELSLKNLFAS